MQAKRIYGFTVIEIVIIVVIIGLLAALSIPALGRARMKSQNTRVASDIKMYAGLIQSYVIDNGEYPPNSNTGAIPAGMEDYIRASQWAEGPPIGGDWDFEAGTYGVLAAFGVHGFNVETAQLVMFDRAYDDGGLGSGSYRLLAPDRYYFIIDE